MLVRQDINALQGPWHPVVRAYALAIGVMRGQPDSEATSLGYQASVHGVGLPTDPPPNDFQSQCQHNCWYFLPWHRWYIYYFEQIVRSVMAGIDEVPDEVAESWALPYWNYHRAGAAVLPYEFGQQLLWDGTRENPLFDATRASGVNDRTLAIDSRLTAPLTGVLDQPFSSPHEGVPTFAGTASGWHHFREPGSSAGGLEGVPHNAVHGFVNGDMGDFSTAGLDPVFWLHHCNIDRYWEVRGHADDPTGQWSTQFDFRDASGASVKVTSDGCVDTEGQLGYRYDDTSRPVPGTPGLQARSDRRAMAPDVPHPELPPEVIGVAGDLRLEGTRRTVELPVEPVSDEFRRARAGRNEPSRVFMTVSEIRGEVDPGISYGVYLNEPTDEQLAGVISFFGVRGTADGSHTLGYTFDVTDIVQALRDDDAWDPSSVTVLFEPIGGVRDGEPESPGEVPGVDIGRVSFLAQ